MGAIQIQSPLPGASSTSNRFQTVRARSQALAAGLTEADQTTQSMPDASPTKWHLAHTTWFFETFILGSHRRGYRAFDPAYPYLFNSYYQQAGPRYPRPQRGLLSRPSATEVTSYRQAVDAAILEGLASGELGGAEALVELGCHHEQQHQELILSDILHLFAQSPLRPAYRPPAPAATMDDVPLRWTSFPGGIVPMGNGGEEFAFDNETPRHEVLLRPFRMANRLVTNSEWMSFINDDGYDTPELWLSDGWAYIQREHVSAPLYWERCDGRWRSMTLHGMHDIVPNAPVEHISFYEADAFARWAGARLPTEHEWEHAVVAAGVELAGEERQSLGAQPADGDGPLLQAFGELWQWTASAYLGYPGYKPAAGAIGEYNGKFMSGQMVLRGSSFATPPGHGRATYRNFFFPRHRWPFIGLRLAAEA